MAPMRDQALPRDIWDQGFEEGERRMNRRPLGQAATGLLGGFEVMIALSVVFTLTGALMTVTNEEVAHAIGALPFGIAFVFISIGRSELFTENFLVPVGARFAGRGSNRQLLAMWGLTLIFNFAGLAVLAALLSIDGVLPQSALDAAGSLGDRFAEREIGAAIASAIVAGAAMTLYTWMTLAARTETTRVLIALLIGYVLLLPVLNHAIVSGGEILLAVMAGTTQTTPWDVIWRLGIAVAGNTVGGVGLITISRLVQVSGEPHDPKHASRGGRNEDG
jgi:formate/nitrite transporter FocA (FNT family)